MLKSGSQRPDVLWLQRRLRSDDATEVPRIMRLLVLRLDTHGRSPSWDAAYWQILSNAVGSLTPRAEKREEECSLRQLPANAGERTDPNNDSRLSASDRCRHSRASLIAWAPRAAAHTPDGVAGGRQPAAGSLGAAKIMSAGPAAFALSTLSRRED